LLNQGCHRSGKSGKLEKVRKIEIGNGNQEKSQGKM